MAQIQVAETMEIQTETEMVVETMEIQAVAQITAQTAAAQIQAPQSQTII